MRKRNSEKKTDKWRWWERTTEIFQCTTDNGLTTLQQLNYMSDHHSINVLRQAIRQLVSKFYKKWEEYWLHFMQSNKPTFMHSDHCYTKKFLHPRTFICHKAKKRNKKNPRETLNRNRIEKIEITGKVFADLFTYSPNFRSS